MSGAKYKAMEIAVHLPANQIALARECDKRGHVTITSDQPATLRAAECMAYKGLGKLFEVRDDAPRASWRFFLTVLGCDVGRVLNSN